MEYTFEEIRNHGNLLFEYVRGSQAYGLSLPTSDTDTGGVFIMDGVEALGLDSLKIHQVNDERNDNVWYEIGKYVELLAKANSTMLESLFVPKRCILYMHPAFKVLYDNRKMFVTKDLITSIIGFCNSQIKKCRGLNKKIVNPVTERKGILDFCYTFKNQGTVPFQDILNENGMRRKYCGLVHLPNMDQMYGVYYDFGNHFKNEGITSVEELITKNARLYKYLNNKLHTYYLGAWISNCKPIGYRGAIDENNKTTQLRMSSVEKGAEPEFFISFNKNGFVSHCKQYKEYKEWVEKRNPQRYLENKEKEFDRKNMMHCARLLNMGIEIAKTGKINVDRTNIDRDFLLNIRLGNSTYEELMKYMNEKLEELNNAIEKCNLPEHCDMKRANEILCEIRRKMYAQH